MLLISNFIMVKFLVFVSILKELVYADDLVFLAAMSHLEVDFD